MQDGIAIITAERERQKQQWSYEHDDGHVAGEIAQAAAIYAMPETMRRPDDWPFESRRYPQYTVDRIEELAKAGALIAAEIDRLMRQERK